jgi:hypothetical protein
MVHQKPFLETTTEEFTKVLNTNLLVRPMLSARCTLCAGRGGAVTRMLRLAV